jgi:hypothetical protein
MAYQVETENTNADLRNEDTASDCRNANGNEIRPQRLGQQCHRGEDKGPAYKRHYPFRLACHGRRI